MSTALNQEEQDLVVKSFEEVKDFRTLGERITAPIDSIIDETTVIIENDPIMDVSDELNTMNSKMQGIYADIIDNDGAIMKFFKRLPIVGTIAEKLDEKWDEQNFNMKTINGQITAIFSGFDQAYTSLNTSIDMQYKFLEGIEKNLGKVIDYKEFLDVKLLEFKTGIEGNKEDKDKLKLFIRSVEFFQTNLTVLIGNLEMAKKRLLIRLDSARKLSLSMNSSKPIFKTLLSIVSLIALIAVIEASIAFCPDISITAVDKSVLNIGFDEFIDKDNFLAESSLIKSLFLAISRFPINTVKFVWKNSTLLIKSFNLSLSSSFPSRPALNSTSLRSKNSL